MHQPIIKVDKTNQLINRKETIKTTPPLVKLRLSHIPLYEGDEDPKKHWFVCEKIWVANNITDEDKQMAHFSIAL